MDNLDHFDAAKTLVLMVPGAVIVLFRSFALRGSFPSISKDDFAAFVLCSVIYNFSMLATQASLPISVSTVVSGLRSTYWFLTFLILPAVVGFILGLFEASDLVGQIMRRIGVKFPSPTPTAWETLFQELQRDAILIITLKDAARVYGRWTAGRLFSSASTDSKTMDIFVAEIGSVNDQGQYLPKSPPRGIYIATSEIRLIEIVWPT